MGADRLYSEIFEEFEKAASRQDKIAVLQKYHSSRIKEFLEIAFNSNVVFDVEIPNYRPAPEPAGLNYTYLSLEVPKLYRFIVNHPKRISNITPQKQKSLLIVVLESLHKDEAELLVQLINKNLKVKGLTPKIVKEAFPDANL